MQLNVWLFIGCLVSLSVAAAGYLIFARRQRRMQQLFEVSVRVNSTLDKKALQQLIMDTAAHLLDAEASSILLVDAATGELYFELALGAAGEAVQQIRLKPGEGIAGKVAQSGAAVIVNDPARDSSWSARVADHTGFQTRNLICVPITHRGKVIGVLQVLNKHRGRPFTQADLHLLMQVGGPIAVALENARLYEELKLTTEAKNRLESELRIAGEIQLSLLPRSPLPERLGAGVEALLLPAKQVGGDYYYYELLADGRLLFAVGDVSDKGMPAALFMAAVVTLLKGRAAASINPAQLLSEVNETICRDDPAQFATVLCGVLHLASGVVELSDGGHCDPFIVSASRGARRIRLDKGLPLGAWGGCEYVNSRLQLEEDECLVICTDGVGEAENRQGVGYGLEGVCSFLERQRHLPPQELPQLLATEVLDYAADLPQFDDIAIMTVWRQPGLGARSGAGGSREEVPGEGEGDVS